jgi:uncharacterized protein YukE
MSKIPAVTNTKKEVCMYFNFTVRTIDNRYRHWKKNNSSVFERIAAVMTAGFLALLLIACGESQEPSQPKTDVTAEDVKQETQEAAETTVEYTQQEMQAYRERIDAQLSQMETQIEQLKSRADDWGGQATAEFQNAMDRLQEQKAAAAQKLEELKQSGAERWEGVKTEMDQAMADLKDAYDKAVSSSSES